MTAERPVWKSNIRAKLTVIAALGAYVVLAWVLGLPCPIEHFAGIPCPGCGMTRAVASLLRGQWRQAFAYHGMVWSLPLIALLFWFEGRLFAKRWMNMAVIAVIAAGFAIHWVLSLFLL